jgi:tetratricopeptide (TPR) repeat protein
MKMFHINSLQRALLIGVLLITSCDVFAFSFVPDQSEWNLWKPYCKARFAENTNSRLVDFKLDISKAEIEKWKKIIGSGEFRHLHHYCAGVIWLHRSYEVSHNQQAKRSRLKNAIGEITYTYSKIDVSSKLYVVMSGKLAEAYEAAGESVKATTVISTLLEKKSKDPAAYVVSAQHYKRKGDLDAAIEILKDGEKNVKKAAKIHYQLAKMYLKKEDYEQSREYARMAGEGGHSINRLKRELKKAGYPL